MEFEKRTRREGGRGGIVSHKRHDFHLDELVNHLDKVGEDKSGIHFIIKDIVLLEKGNTRRMTSPDLLVGFYDGSLVPVELKGSREKKSKALKQLDAGKRFAEEALGYSVPYSKFVTYSRSGYEYENVLG